MLDTLMEPDRIADDEMDLSALLRNLWEERFVIFFGVLIAGLIAVAYLWRQTPMYQASVDFQTELRGVFAGVLEDLPPEAAISEFIANVTLFATFAGYFRTWPAQLGCPS